MSFFKSYFSNTKERRKRKERRKEKKKERKKKEGKKERERERKREREERKKKRKKEDFVRSICVPRRHEQVLTFPRIFGVKFSSSLFFALFIRVDQITARSLES